MTPKLVRDKSNYRLDLEHFCENCPNFDILDDCTEYDSNIYGEQKRYFHRITCKNMVMCDNIYGHILRQEKEKQKEENKNEKSS